MTKQVMPGLLVVPPACERLAERRLESFVRTADRLELTTNDGRYIITPYSEQIFETTFIPNGQQFEPQSHAVAMAPQAVDIAFVNAADRIEYASAGLAVTIAKSPFRIAYAYRGQPLVAEKRGYFRREDGMEVIDFELDTNEMLYGGGARALGMNRRGNRLRLYNKAHYGYETRSELLNYTLPLVLSSRCYGLHFDNAPAGYLDLDERRTNTLAYETISGRKTYQVIAADSWEQLVGNYTLLTGRQPLPPRWAFGNFASRFGYHSEAQARETVARFQAAGIPLDAIIFDLYWFGKEIQGSMGNLRFDRDQFPDPQRMIADFAAQGIKTILITEPLLLTASERWPEAVQQQILATAPDGSAASFDSYFGQTGLIDIFGQKGEDWFWAIYRELRQLGVAGWWGDLGEPEEHPSWVRHASGSADELHNIYGHQWARLIAEGYRREFPAERPFILMRSGYSGSQRFGLIPWSGDVNRSWGGLQSQPEIALQMGMQGLAYMHSDLGGFAGANLDDELYTRWLQYGVFQPVFRPHAQEEVASEPVYREPRTMALAREAILLRYRLLPYNYTLGFDNNQQGLPLMRPLMFEEPDNVELQTECGTYLWGPALLVSPVLEAGARSKEIYFPGRSAWFDFYSGQRHACGSTATVALVAEHIPLYVRAGSFIPMSVPISSTREYSSRRVALHYYHDASVAHASGKLYDDDGATAGAYEQGLYELMHFTSSYDAMALGFTFSTERGRGVAPAARQFDMSVHQIAERPRGVAVGGRSVAFDWDSERKLLSFSVAVGADGAATAEVLL